jgi:hypothetical protein
MSPNQYIVTSRLRVALFYAYLLAIGVLALVLGKVIIDNRDTAREAHRGLCSLKAERARRVGQTIEILQHPERGENALIIKNLGRTILVRSLATARADLLSLRDVDCR